MEFLPAEEDEGLLLDRRHPVGLDSERLGQDGCNAPCAVIGSGARRPVEALHRDSGSEVGPIPSRRLGTDRIERHENACPGVLEAVGEETRGQVEGLVETRQRPNVGDPVERREERDGFGQTAIEGGGLVRPGDAGDPIPERLAIDPVVEHDGVAELADLAPDEAVTASLVPRKPTRVGGGQLGGAGGGTWGWHSRTIPGDPGPDGPVGPARPPLARASPGG